jgi:hypothetical protein
MTNEDVVRQMEDQRRPFTEEFIDKNTVIRHFDPTADDHLYKWHRDPEDREIIVLNENDWKFQFDNEIPQMLEINNIIKIKKGEYHRLIKGTTLLSLKILY